MKRLVNRVKKTDSISTPTKPSSVDLAGALALAIDAKIAEDIKPRYKKSTGFAPSDTSLCPRYWYYKFNGIWIQPDHDARVQRIFDMGHGVHDRIKNYLRDLDILIVEEMPVPNREGYPPVSGFADALIEWDGQKVVEIKSIGDAGFNMVRLKNKPKDDHYQQIQLYLHYFELDEGYLIYENKNNQEMLVLKCTYNSDYVEKLMKKYRKIWKAFEDNIKPLRPYKETSRYCQFCKMNTSCWNDPEEGLPI